MIKNQSIWLIFSYFLLIILTGCSGMSYAPNDPTKWQVKYYSNPTGAEIYVDGQYVGTAPIAFNYPSIGISSKKVVAKFPSGREQIVTSGYYTFEILFDFTNNKAKIKDYPTAFSLFANTREVIFEEQTPQSLTDAIIKNDILEVEKFIENGSDVNEKPTNGITPLFVAVETNNLKAVKMLLKKGATPNTHSSDGRFPLLVASVTGNSAIVENLLASNADPNMRNKVGGTALMWAAFQGHIDIVKLLLNNNANAFLSDVNNHTALDYAIQKNNHTIAEIIRSEIKNNNPLNESSPNQTAPPVDDYIFYSGTGWITQNGYIVTNYHVIENQVEIKIRFNSYGEKLFPAEIILSDRYNDLAILKLISNNQPKLPGIPISSSLPKLGENVFTIGYPKSSIMGRNPKITNGIVSALSGILDDPRIIQTTVAIQSGNSGGPLLNLEGHVVGVTTSSLRTLVTRSGIDVPQSVNYAVKSAYVVALLSSLPEGNNYPMVILTSFNLEDIVPKVQDSIVQIIVKSKKTE